MKTLFFSMSLPPTALAIALLIGSISTIPFVSTVAQTAPDRNGDYFSNLAPVQGTTHSPLSPGSLWQVVTPKLNCRRGAGINLPVVQTFAQGTILQAEVGRGGSDEVLVNAKDAQGKPWMSVRSKDRCYVRANRHYIQPVTRKGKP